MGAFKVARMESRTSSREKLLGLVLACAEKAVGLNLLVIDGASFSGRQDFPSSATHLRRNPGVFPLPLDR
jgi:hypothetical protein